MLLCKGTCAPVAPSFKGQGVQCPRRVPPFRRPWSEQFTTAKLAALMSCRIRAVEHRKCAAGLSDAYPGLQDRIMLNYTRIENAHKVRK